MDSKGLNNTPNLGNSKDTNKGELEHMVSLAVLPIFRERPSIVPCTIADPCQQTE